MSAWRKQWYSARRRRGCAADRITSPTPTSPNCNEPSVAILVVSLFVFVFVLMFLRSRFTGPPHEGLYLLEGESPIFVGIHRLEDFFVSGLKFLQRDGSVTIAIHQSEDEAHSGSSPHHASSSHHATASPHDGVTLVTTPTGAFFGTSTTL